jgi:LAO/AO transport system kinase
VQTLKAGIMEIGDVFVVNKADRPDADRAVVELKMVLGFAAAAGWRPPVLTSIATSGRGVGDLLTAIADHRRHLDATGGLAGRRRARWRREILQIAERRLRARYLDGAVAASLDGLLQRVASGELDPYEAADRLLASQP